MIISKLTLLESLLNTKRFSSILLLLILLAADTTTSARTHHSATTSPLFRRGHRGGTSLETINSSPDEGKLTNMVNSSPRQQAIVVGGGPIGLAAALMLANEPHCYDVCVYESSSGESGVVKYDTSKAYLYNINQRGQVFTKKFSSVQRRLEERGVAMTFGSGIVRVPADPKKPIPKASLSTGVNKSDYDEAAQKRRISYWIPRHSMIEVFHDTIDEYEKNRDGNMGRIQLFSGKECVSVRPSNPADVNNSVVVVTVKDVSTNVEHTREAKLVVGADGINSKIRECLSTDVDSYASWNNVNHKQFVPKKWVSPSTGLRIKALQLPPQFEINDHDGTPIKTHSQTAYVIISVNKGTRTQVNLGVLPMKDNTAIRPVNICTRPNHEIWTITDGEEMRQWFEKSYPRMPFHKQGIIPAKEWDRFAKAIGTRFPTCQYSPGLYVSSPDGECGIVLVGDAIHAFPPDIGQGINAGLGDVVVLDEALRGVSASTTEKTLGTALEAYERERAPEVKALIRLARFGSPYQYRQPLRMDVFFRRLWTMNVVLRLLLNKISFGIIPTASIMLSQNPDLSFRQVMFRADMVTAGLTGAAAWGMYRFARKFIMA